MKGRELLNVEGAVMVLLSLAVVVGWGRVIARGDAENAEGSA